MGLLGHKLYQKQDKGFQTWAVQGSGYQELWCHRVGWGKSAGEKEEEGQDSCFYQVSFTSFLYMNFCKSFCLN